MINIMRADVYRIFKGIGIYIAILMIVVMATVGVVMREPGYIGNATIAYEDEEVFATTDTYDVSSESNDEQNQGFVRDIISNNINLYYPLIIIVFVLLMSDFSNHTIKNTLTSAVSKKKYYMTKLFMILLSSVVFIVFCNLFVYVLNFIVNGKEYTEPISNTFKATFLQMPMLLGAVSLLTMLGFLLKKAASFNAVAITFVMLFQIVISAIQRISESTTLRKFLSEYELQAALAKLAYFPEKKYVLTCTCIGVVEIVLSSILGYYIFKKSEIK